MRRNCRTCLGNVEIMVLFCIISMQYFYLIIYHIIIKLGIFNLGSSPSTTVKRKVAVELDPLTRESHCRHSIGKFARVG